MGRVGAMSETSAKYEYGTAISVEIKGGYVSHAELAPLLDALGEHAFTVRGSRDNWEGPMVSGTEVVLWFAITGGTAYVVGFFQKLTLVANSGRDGGGHRGCCSGAGR